MKTDRKVVKRRGKRGRRNQEERGEEEGCQTKRREDRKRRGMKADKYGVKKTGRVEGDADRKRGVKKKASHIRRREDKKRRGMKTDR